VTRVVLLHTNDIHGRVEGIARIATVVERIRREEPDAQVLYADAGDVEDTSAWLSNVTKGAAMHRLLSAAGCAVATTGNASWVRYGTQVMPDHAHAAAYPLLAANLRARDGSPLPGTSDTALLGEVGFVGVTTRADEFHDDPEELFAVSVLDEAAVLRAHAAELRGRGAAVVVCLSHLGLPLDRDLARAVEGHVDVIVGGHSHDLLPEGERIGPVLVVQAGEYAQHLGRVDVEDGAARARVLSVAEDVRPHPAVLAAEAEAEEAAQATLDEVVAFLDRPLDSQWLAEMLRERMGGELGLAVAGAHLPEPLPAGPLSRGELWRVCDSSANPGLATIEGARLLQMLERGRDPEFQRATPRALRGRQQGRLHLAGAETIDPARSYAVAGTDWELEFYGGLVDREWELEITYDFPTIVREAIEEHLTR
jgi:2',3'-cyclic-nucleotide 2'-phosphodiesterase (5'-nucleotidase family)